VTTRRSLLAFTAASAARIVGAADRIQMGVIGTGGRGAYLAGQFKEHGADVTAVCDVYEPRLAIGLKAASAGAKPYIDYRRLLEDKSLKAVVIATPDHLHASMLIAAVEAGKDVYVEKPLAHTIEDGFRMVDAVRRTKRIALVGTQRRSYDLYQEAKGIMDSKVTGDIRLVTSAWLNHQPRLVPPVLKGTLNWDLFLGPAPKRPLDPSRLFNWLYFSDYSGGMMIGQAAHIIDGIQWMMNSTVPIAVTAAGGQPNLEGAETTETSSMIVEFPQNYITTFTVGYKAMRYNQFNDQMQQFHGSAARFDLGRESYAVYPQSTEVDMKPSRERRSPGTFEGASRAHVRHFLEILRTRGEPNSTVEMGQATNIVLCMAAQSMRAKRRVVWDASQRRMA
jgi:predicted dehydrogenase